MSDTEKKLDCLLDYYNKLAKNPEQALTICPFEISEGVGKQFRQYTCGELCFAFDEMKPDGKTDTDTWLDCPCEYFGTYGAFEKLKKLLIEYDMIKDPKKQCKDTKKYGWLHLFFHDWHRHRDNKTFRKCRICEKMQYKIYTDSGILSCWLDLY